MWLYVTHCTDHNKWDMAKLSTENWLPGELKYDNSINTDNLLIVDDQRLAQLSSFSIV